MAARLIKPTSRRRDSRRLTGMSLIAFAIVVAAVVHRRAAATEPLPPPPPVVAEFDTVAVPVPVAGVAAGTKVKAVRFRTVRYPKHQLPPGAIVDVTPHLEAVTMAPLPASLPLFEENLSRGGVSNPVIERIPAGMRAMTIKVDATAAVEGWAGSGAIVDVLLVERDRTAVVAEKVRILSAERSVSPVEGAAAPSVPSTVTLLVTQEQCLAINTAIPRGRIAFALRSNEDEESWSSTLFTADRLKGNALPSEVRSSITGFAAVKGAAPRSFALANGRWIPTEVIPEGFLAAEPGRETGE